MNNILRHSKSRLCNLRINDQHALKERDTETFFRRKKKER